MEEDETYIDFNLNYLNHFQSHLADISSHLNGSGHERGRLRPSFLPPCGYWSQEDKDRFFHALSIHSRFRLDLIAAEIPGKTTADVCVYLDLLAEGAAKEPKTWKRLTFPRALEVSDDWIEFEEKQARAIATMEPTWEAEQCEDTRSAILRAKKRALRKQDSEGEGETKDTDGEYRRNTIFKEFRAEQEAGWEKEDYMGDLGAMNLKAIDNILREAEELSMGDNSDTIAQIQAADLVEYGRNATTNSPGISVVQSIPAPSTDLPISLDDAQEPSVKQTSSQFNDFGNAILQSSTLSGQSDADNDVERGLHNLEIDVFDNPSYTVVDVGSLSPKSRRRYQKRLYMRRKRALQSGREVDSTVTRLKPGRKTNKRLLSQEARQKAQAIENMDTRDGIDLQEASFTIPPEKEDRKENYTDVHEGKEEFEISLGSDRDEPRRTGSPTVHGQKKALLDFHPSIGGPTPPYKTKKKLIDLGYDAQTLESEGLGLFHCSKLADLMSLHASLEEIEPDIATRISAHLIKLLHAEVVWFVTDLMHRAMAIHEQARLLKGHTKVWRTSNERISSKAIHQALETTGVRRDKKEHFAPLLSQLASVDQLAEMRDEDEADHREDGRAEISDMEANNDEQEDGEGDDNYLSMGEDVIQEASSIREVGPVVPLHRQIYAPFMWHPSLDHLVPDPFVPSEASLNVDNKSDDNFDVSDDSKKLIRELLEEEELDVADLDAARKVEEELWEEAGLHAGCGVISEPQQPQVPEQKDVDPEPRSTVGRKRRLRKLKLGIAKRVRSSVYVEDND